MRDIVKIGIIGPKPYLIGETDTVSRDKIRTGIGQILSDLKKEYPTLLGLTGLDLGVEQDFAVACSYYDIDYYCYVAYAQIYEGWNKLPESVTENYLKLLNSSVGYTILSEGKFSPKKNFSKKLKIISQSDFIIYVPVPHLEKENDIFIRELFTKDKVVFIL